jgi:hypothetical protein
MTFSFSAVRRSVVLHFKLKKLNVYILIHMIWVLNF